MKITRIAKHPRRDRTRIHVNGETEPRLELAIDVLASAGIGVGDILDAGRVAALEREDEVLRARDLALRLLAVRPRSRFELRQRLERGDMPDPVIERTLSWLEDRNYLDDRVFAESFVRDRLRLRPRGRIGLVRELRRRGVAEAVAEAATEAVLTEEGTDDGDLAIQAARSWARRNGPLIRGARRDAELRRRARRRLYGHLARRGFEPDAVRVAIDSVLHD